MSSSNHIAMNDICHSSLGQGMLNLIPILAILKMKILSAFGTQLKLARYFIRSNLSNMSIFVANISYGLQWLVRNARHDYPRTETK